MENSSFPEKNTVADDVSFENEEEVKVKYEESERNFPGNRWPRQETVALLKIRSEMDVAFRDSGVKGPLWEEVSRFPYLLLIFFSWKKLTEKGGKFLGFRQKMWETFFFSFMLGYLIPSCLITLF